MMNMQALSTYHKVTFGLVYTDIWFLMYDVVSYPGGSQVTL